VIRYGFHASPFGTALVMATDRGLAGLAFADEGEQNSALADMTRRWPRADYVEDFAATAQLARRVFHPHNWRPETPLRIVLIGSDFEIRVWEALLTVPFGTATTYSDLARRIERPRAARAVGAAVGRNPVSFVVPCHRVLGRSGSLTGYHWGLTRKRAILGWEAGIAAQA
jgi:AraC family transcriptional regulator of adaptative response/methylated-DNA-[protein]-cysteine methyltransferase